MRISLGFALVLILMLLSGAYAQAVTMTFDSAPEITFEVPAGWAACDPITSGQLQGPPPVGKMKSLCGIFNNKGGARMVGSSNGSLVLSFAVTDPTVFPPAYFQSVTPQQITDESANLCQSVLKVSAGTAPCVFELRNVANRPAITGRVSTPNGEFVVGRVVLIPGENRSAIFIFLSSQPSGDADDRMEAIVASIRVSEKAEQR
jgi:hypothetical protein